MLTGLLLDDAVINCFHDEPSAADVQRCVSCSQPAMVRPAGRCINCFTEFYSTYETPNPGPNSA